MARLSLKAMRENVKAKEGGNYDSEFWTPMDNLDMNGTAMIRFVPFIDEISSGFWTIQKTLTATFVNPDDDNESWYVKIPCLEMYTNDEKCPATDIVRGIFKEADELIKQGNTDEGEGLKKIALGHWIRYSYLMEGFVLSGGNKTISDAQLVPFRLPKSMFTIIRDSVMSDDSEFEELPCGSFEQSDLDCLANGELPDGMSEGEFASLFTGRPFNAKKTKKDKFNNYDSSNWSMKEHEMTDEQIEALTENGFIDLRKFLPKQPSAEMYEVYAELMQISIDAALGNGDNTWNPEWETKYGIKPIKPKNSDSNGGGGNNARSSNADVRSKLSGKLGKKAAASEEDEGESKPRSSASDIRSKLNKSRGKKDESAEDSSVNESTGSEEDNSSGEDDGGSEKSTGASARASSLSARLKAKAQAAKENA